MKKITSFLNKNELISGISSTVITQNWNALGDMYIDLDEPHHTKKPGESVTGTVHVVVKKRLVNVCVKLSVVGMIKVNVGNASTWKKSQLFSRETALFGSTDGDEVFGLTKGTHQFPFSIRLPRRNIYPSISFERGEVSYVVCANCLNVLSDTENNVLAACEKLIKIQCPINVARVPSTGAVSLVIRGPSGAAHGAQRKFLKSLSSSSTLSSAQSATSTGSTGSNDTAESDSSSRVSSGSAQSAQAIRLQVSTQSDGFLPNDLIPVTVNLTHIKNVKLRTGLIISLIRICKIDDSPGGRVQSFRKDLQQVVKPLYLDPSSLECNITTNLRVPYDVFQTINIAPLLSFEYYVEVVANLGAKSRQELSSKRDKTPDSGPDTKFINVDKLRRSKNVVSVLKKIVIGTERVAEAAQTQMQTQTSQQETQNPSPQTQPQNQAQAQPQAPPIPIPVSSPATVPSSSPGTVPGTVPVLASVPNPVPAPATAVPLAAAAAVSPSAPALPQHSIESPALSVPGAPLAPPPLPAPQALTEKEALQIREMSLLPSEPPDFRRPTHTNLENINEVLEHEVTDYVPQYEPNDYTENQGNGENG